MNRSMVFLSINLLISVFREGCDTPLALPVHCTLWTVYLVRVNYIRGPQLFERCGVEAVMGGVCSRCLPKV